MKAAMITAAVTSGWKREDAHFQILNALTIDPIMLKVI